MQDPGCKMYCTVQGELLDPGSGCLVGGGGDSRSWAERVGDSDLGWDGTLPGDWASLPTPAPACTSLPRSTLGQNVRDDRRTT